MSKRLLYFITFFTIAISHAQKDRELFRINDKSIKVSEFKQVYEKNLAILEDQESKDIDKYLELFINYKLKVQEAYNLRLDTLKGYKRELESYKNQLIAPYLQDQEYLNNLIKEAYNRTKKEVKASHILLKFPGKGIEIDTTFLYQKINNIRDRVIAGENFEEVAKEVSEDPSAKNNGGNLGYFSAFTMVYPFEDIVYNTKVGEVSKPFETRFGYHIVKVTDKRASKGEFEVAHVLVKNAQGSKEKIDSLYKKLQEGVSFEEVAKKYSEDIGIASLGGKLPRFGTGRMVEPFENEVRNLNEIGGYSKPFKTKYGWHIVKLLKNYPVGSFEEVKDELTNKVKTSNRAALSKKAVLKKLKGEYKIEENKKALNVFLNTHVHKLKKENLKEVLFSVNETKTLQKDFLQFIGHKHKQSIKELYDEFKNIQIISYFKEDLVNREPEYRNILIEYQEGLLLFDLMEKKIWNKSSKDTSELEQFYTLNKSKYKGKKLNDIRGKVMNDYQKELEEKWIKSLRENNSIKIKEREVRKLKKIYN